MAELRGGTHYSPKNNIARLQFAQGQMNKSVL